MLNLKNIIKTNPIISLIFDDEVIQNKSGNRLSDLQLQTNSYNGVIPVIYGTVRLAGNIIWQTNLLEVENNYTQYHGNLQQNITKYEYFINIAIGICNGECILKNIYVDDVLIDIEKYSYRFYNGSEGQMPDLLMPNIAYRGLCYIVFENFPLAEFNNKIPTFNFEISKIATNENDIENKINAVNIIPGYGEFIYAPEIIKKHNGILQYGVWHSNGELVNINQNNNQNVSDAVLSIQQLKKSLPNCNWISPSVAWFCNSLNIANCNIEPKCDFNTPITFEPYTWQVGEKTRLNANVVNRYGGTICDMAIVNYFAYLKEMGFKNMFYPILLMDLADKPWRGYLTGNTNNLATFFTKYNNFILHYATLLQGKVDCFLIGSELIGITKIPGAIGYLVNLAAQVKAILGQNVLVSYTANWNEYADLGELWSSSFIDFVGINMYIPLTNDIQENITKQSIVDAWSEINLVNFGKKIWFCEYGFASVNCTSNEPSNGVLPDLSDGKINNFAQRQAIEATIEFWQDKVYVERMFLYCWDARPYPFFPAKVDIWTDGDDWYRGHWINGKLCVLTFENLIKMLFVDNLNLLGDIEIYDLVEGIVLNEITNLNEVIKMLQGIYFFDYVEHNGKLHFRKKHRPISYEIDEGELIDFYETIKYVDLADKIYVKFLNRDNNSKESNVYAN
ncbi:MAG: glycoside hydrolase TIM-barrel-like domain-containing protein [Rickettsiales bacterium]|jgi:hypothetical protein|nr:glycoside hydrolase TIM-barrel-like domain-containing protein [Rickettsiales bacterium]